MTQPQKYPPKTQDANTLIDRQKDRCANKQQAGSICIQRQQSRALKLYEFGAASYAHGPFKLGTCPDLLAGRQADGVYTL